MAEIEALLKKAIGTDVTLIGAALLENAVKRRLVALDLTNISFYPTLLHRSAAELQALIDEVIVPETWFFRDRGAFTALAGLLPRGGERVLRLLSLPCATGEEPYSIAIALLSAGLPAAGFCIDGLDVSATVLAKAKRAIYGRNSFRGTDLGFRDQYFEPVGSGYRPIEPLRRQVRFAPANLLDPNLLTGTPPYDAVFCRNVLIYFDRVTQEQVLHRLSRVIVPNGLLFVGPSEQSLATSCGFTSLRMAHSFGFRLTHAAPTPIKRDFQKSPATQRLPPVLPMPKRLPMQVQLPRPAGHPAPSLACQPVDLLTRARQLADAGRFTEAGIACEAAVRQGGPSAELYFLLGLIRDAADDASEAIKLYRKALYLDPNHLETLHHLSLLLHKRHHPSASTLEARLVRLRQQDIARQEQRP